MGATSSARRPRLRRRSGGGGRRAHGVRLRREPRRTACARGRSAGRQAWPTGRSSTAHQGLACWRGQRPSGSRRMGATVRMGRSPPATSARACSAIPRWRPPLVLWLCASSSASPSFVYVLHWRIRQLRRFSDRIRGDRRQTFPSPPVAGILHPGVQSVARSSRALWHQFGVGVIGVATGEYAAWTLCRPSSSERGHALRSSTVTSARHLVFRNASSL